MFEILLPEVLFFWGGGGWNVMWYVWGRVQCILGKKNVFFMHHRAFHRPVVLKLFISRTPKLIPIRPQALFNDLFA